MGGCKKLNTNDFLLKRFYIAKEYRGSGIARQLLEKIINTAKSYRINRIVIDVSKKNARAIHFYEKNGFIQYNQSPIEAWKETSQSDIFNYYSLNI